jgi:hypothetical protein
MLMPSDPTALNDFPTDPYIGEPYVMFAGTPFQHLMIPLPGYYDFTPSIMNAIPEIDLSVLDHSSNEWKIGAFSSAWYVVQIAYTVSTIHIGRFNT